MNAFNRRDFLKTASAVGITGSFVSHSFAQGAETSVGITLTRARWLFSQTDEPIADWLKSQLEDLLKKFSKKDLRITKSRKKADIAVGTVKSNPLIQLAQQQSLMDGSALAKEDYMLKTVLLNGKEVLLIVGGSETAACYGVFELFERLGFRFLVSGDIYPERTELQIPKFDEIITCTQPWRSFCMCPCITTTSMLSLDDYEKLLDQMVKMRVNKLQFFLFDCDPFTDYSYKGERKLVGDISDPDSGYISYGRFHGSFLTEDIEVGREKFGDRKRIAPKELQDVSTSNEAMDAGKAFIQAVMRSGKKRNIGVWILFEPQYVAPNMSKYTRKMPHPHAHWSYHVSCVDPVADEINRNRIINLIESYPDMEGISLSIPEGFFGDPYEDSQKLIEERLPDYSESLEIMGQYWNKYPGWGTKEQQTKHMRADIAFTELAMKAVKMAREIKPDLPLAILTVCKAYLLVKLHDILDKDITFIDFESSSLWTVGYAPLHLFERMKDRDCVIVPRAVDDGSLAGMQFNLKLYDKDGFIRSGKDYGMKGFAIQLSHTAGNEHNVDYLIKGLWNSGLTVEQYYRDYAETVFGKAAAPTLIKAFDILEENEIALGGRGAANMPWNQQPYEITILKDLRTYDLKFFNCYFGEWWINRCKSRIVLFTEALGKLKQADELFAKARKQCRAGGAKILGYMIERNRGYIAHLESLVTLMKSYEQYYESFKVVSDLDKFKTMLSETIETAKQAHQKAILSAEHFATCCSATSDLGVLWSIDNSMIKGTRLFVGYLESITAFYHGKDYDLPLEWDKVFGAYPFPTCDIDKIQGVNVSAYEPG